LWIRSQSLMAGYFEKPADTSAAFSPDGWLRSGDLGSMDGRGVVRFAGRVKEMINRAGENIYPPEIEDVLGSHPAVDEAAVIGIPDDHWGEQVGAAVRLKPGRPATEKDLVAYLEARLAPHKVPRRWRFVDELPHTASGKVQKFVLREQWGGR
jgi:fatty-acyl-CoA synthase